MRELQPTRHPLRGIVIAGLLALLAVCWCSGSALAAGGALIGVGPGFGEGKPAIAVDLSGTAYLAWPQAGAEGEITNKVGYCVLPAAASACSQQGTLTPAENPRIVESVSLAIDGGTVVMVARNYQSGSEETAPIQEWTTPDGSATFTAVDGGKSVANPVGGQGNLVVLPGSNSLGFGSGEIGLNADEFSVWTGSSSLTNPPVCSVKSCPTPTTTELNTANGTFISQAYSDYASQTAESDSGVLGVFNTPFTPCNNGNAGTSYIYGAGPQAAVNSYAIAPGRAKSAWAMPIANIDCSGYNPAAAGGPSGFGEIEFNGNTRSVVYRPFDQAEGTFRPEVDIGGEEGALDTSLSQDSSGGIYATWFDQYAPGGAAIRLAYSSTGGASWEGPVSLTADALPQSEVSSAVGADGQGWAVSLQTTSGNRQIYVQPFVKGDAYVPSASGGNSAPSLASAGITTSQNGAGQTGASITITAGTTGETDQAHVTGANASIAGGTVHYYLYADSTCDPGVGEVFDGGTSTVTDGVAAPSKSVTEALGPGTYYWQAEYSGDALNSAAKTACGSEVLTVLPAAQGSSSGTSNGSSVTITITCETSTPCTVTVTITATEVTVAVKADAARRKVRRTRMITLATGTFKVGAHSSKKLAVHLTRAGKKLLAKDHGHLKGTVVVADKTSGGLVKSKRSISITTKHAGRHR
jgi:hypothetical protein